MLQVQNPPSRRPHFARPAAALALRPAPPRAPKNPFSVRPRPLSFPALSAALAASPVRLRLAGLAWLAAPLLAHVAFSRIGFNPTDEGWLPAVARRLLEGEVPHRDFIFVRPALSAALQVPFVAVGGDHVLWLVRGWGWLVLGAICWLWTRRFAGETSPVFRYALYLAALAAAAHTFPVMGWHTLDALLLASAAVVAAASPLSPARLAVAFALVGTAALCRQNFGLFAPWLLLAVGLPPRRWPAAVAWTLAPVAAYFALMAALGAGPAAVQQLAAPGGGLLWRAGVVAFVAEPAWLAGLAAGAALGLLARRRHLRPAWGTALFLAPAAVLAAALATHPGWFAFATFVLHGLVAALGLAARPKLPADARFAAVAVAGLGWTTAVSLGYNTPALCAGPLLVVLWRLGRELTAPAPAPSPAVSPLAPIHPTRAQWLLVPLAVAAVAALAIGRHRFPYLDHPAAHLTHDVGAVLPGGAGLRTNTHLHAVLADLQALRGRLAADRRPHAILTDFSAAWIRSPARNPLPVEWAQETELAFHPALFRRVFHALRDLPPETVIVVQKHLVADLGAHRTPVPAGSPFYFVQNWVREHCPPRGETEFFLLVGPPPAAAFKRP